MLVPQSDVAQWRTVSRQSDYHPISLATIVKVHPDCCAQNQQRQKNASPSAGSSPKFPSVGDTTTAAFVAASSSSSNQQQQRSNSPIPTPFSPTPLVQPSPVPSSNVLLAQGEHCFVAVIPPPQQTQAASQQQSNATERSSSASDGQQQGFSSPDRKMSSGGAGAGAAGGNDTDESNEGSPASPPPPPTSTSTIVVWSKDATVLTRCFSGHEPEDGPVVSLCPSVETIGRFTSVFVTGTQTTLTLWLVRPLAAPLTSPGVACCVPRVVFDAVQPLMHIKNDGAFLRTPTLFVTESVYQGGSISVGAVGSSSSGVPQQDSSSGGTGGGASSSSGGATAQQQQQQQQQQQSSSSASTSSLVAMTAGCSLSWSIDVLFFSDKPEARSLCRTGIGLGMPVPNDNFLVQYQRPVETLQVEKTNPTIHNQHAVNPLMSTHPPLFAFSVSDDSIVTSTPDCCSTTPNWVPCEDTDGALIALAWVVPPSQPYHHHVHHYDPASGSGSSSSTAAGSAAGSSTILATALSPQSSCTTMTPSSSSHQPSPSASLTAGNSMPLLPPASPPSAHHQQHQPHHQYLLHHQQLQQHQQASSSSSAKIVCATSSRIVISRVGTGGKAEKLHKIMCGGGPKSGTVVFRNITCSYGDKLWIQYSFRKDAVGTSPTPPNAAAPFGIEFNPSNNNNNNGSSTLSGGSFGTGGGGGGGTASTTSSQPASPTGGPAASVMELVCVSLTRAAATSSGLHFSSTSTDSMGSSRANSTANVGGSNNTNVVNPRSPTTTRGGGSSSDASSSSAFPGLHPPTASTSSSTTTFSFADKFSNLGSSSSSSSSSLSSPHHLSLHISDKPVRLPSLQTVASVFQQIACPVWVAPQVLLFDGARRRLSLGSLQVCLEKFGPLLSSTVIPRHMRFGPGGGGAAAGFGASASAFSSSARGGTGSSSSGGAPCSSGTSPGGGSSGGSSVGPKLWKFGKSAPTQALASGSSSNSTPAPLPAASSAPHAVVASAARAEAVDSPPSSASTSLMIPDSSSSSTAAPPSELLFGVGPESTNATPILSSEHSGAGESQRRKQRCANGAREIMGILRDEKLLVESIDPDVEESILRSIAAVISKVADS